MLRAYAAVLAVSCFAQYSFAQEAPTKAETIVRPGSEVVSGQTPPAPDNETRPTEAADAIKKRDQTAAIADVKPTEGNNVRGQLEFVQTREGVKVIGKIEGLEPKSIHGFHIHENGDCSAPDASSAGSHFNPKNAKHGVLGQTKHAHLGDLGNLSADSLGVATIDRTFKKLKVNAGKDQILGRAVVVHSKADDLKTQPSGDSGARIACGVITKPSHPNTETIQ
ncbi:MAG TPA: superoxide dismutase family protein [Bdellovibrionales bacterium]|nr:superoxide dismutase family protein [Bdellovibrionales bacterium]